jgi:hypothetical protein
MRDARVLGVATTVGLRARSMALMAGMMLFSVVVVVGLFGVTVVGLAGCSVPPSADEQSEGNAPVEEETSEMPEAPETQPEYAVALPDISSEELLADFASDQNYTDFAPNVGGATAAIDRENEAVFIEIEVLSADMETMIETAQAFAHCLSDRSHVTAPDGTEASDNGPCGMLYEAYSLSIRCTAQDGTGTTVIDGWLPAGAKEMTWQ